MRVMCLSLVFITLSQCEVSEGSVSDAFLVQMVQFCKKGCNRTTVFRSATYDVLNLTCKVANVKNSDKQITQTPAQAPWLLVGYPNPYPHFRKVNLQNSSTEEYLYLHYRDSFVLVYLSSLKMVLMSQASRRRLLLVSPGGEQNITLRKIPVARDMAADDVKQIIFYSVGYHIYTIAYNGTKIHKPYNSKTKPVLSFTIDTKRSKLIYSLGRSIVTTNYKGEYPNTLVTKKRMKDNKLKSHLAFDTERNVLYYSFEKQIFRVNVQGKTKTKLTDVLHSPHYRKYYKDNIYFSDDAPKPNHGKIRVLNVIDSGVHTIEMNFKGMHRPLRLCVIHDD